MYYYLASTYGSGSYNASSYNGQSTTSTGTSGTSASAKTLTNTGFPILPVIVVALLVMGIATALVVRGRHKRPSDAPKVQKSGYGSSSF